MRKLINLTSEELERRKKDIESELEYRDTKFMKEHVEGMLNKVRRNIDNVAEVEQEYDYESKSIKITFEIMDMI